MTISIRFARLFAVAAIAVALPSSAARAQEQIVDVHWRPWIGCWRPVSQLSTTEPLPKICVLPGSESASVEIATVDSGRVISRHTVDASGTKHPVNREGCSGFETARWSSDSLRVFLQSELACGGISRATSGIMSFTRGGEWVDIQTLKVAANDMVRAVRYIDAAGSPDLPPEVSSVVAESRRLDRRAALLAAGGPVSTAAIIEAARQLDTTTMQAWLVERGDAPAVDARTLVTLADAGVPGSVTDVMVALGYPDQFRLTNETSAPLTEMDSARIATRYLGRSAFDCWGGARYSPFGWGIDPCYDFAYRGYGYRYGSAARYGYGSYYGQPYYGYYARPVVIVRGDDTQKAVAVKGQGYTRASSSRGESAGSRSESPAGSSSAGSSSRTSSSGGSSSAGSSSSSGSGSSSSSGRTARTRPPGE